MITNTIGLNASRQLHQISNNQNRASERLASGRRINRAADDAAGLAISERLLNQIAGLNQALRNTGDAVSLVRTAEGAMGGISDILARARELTVQAASDTLTQSARGAIYSEISQILSEVDNIARRTEFNTMPLLDQNREFGFQTGANAGQRLEAMINSMNLDNLGLSNFAQVFGDAAQSGVPAGGLILSGLLDTLDGAIGAVSGARAHIGAVENRLNHTANNLANASVNAAAANSRIRDADMALEMINLNRNNVLQQAALSMVVASTNMQRNHVARLLG